jgi:hypothetical protein
VKAHPSPISATVPTPSVGGNGGDSLKRVGPRRYRYVGLDWTDAEMRRAYDREAQRRWRAANCKKKRCV